METSHNGIITEINGPVVKGSGLADAFIGEQVHVGNAELPGEVIRASRETAVIQVYEDTTGLSIGEKISRTGKPLSVELGPGLIGSIFDGLQRPLVLMAGENPFIQRGSIHHPLSREKRWHFIPCVTKGEPLQANAIIGTVRETEAFTHRILSPRIPGTVRDIANEGDYYIEEIIARVETNNETKGIALLSRFPVRTPRPSGAYVRPKDLLVTGQRVLDFLFPLAKGGTAIIPGGFGAGKTITQHQLAKWSDADVIIYIGCGERGNEMVQVLEEFPSLIDPRTGRPLMERTVLIANTSNMPVTAREASIYTGIAIAEYFRDMGYDTALMADSTSRWAESLREISGRLEELPIEEGYPSYLSHRLAEFYERAGKRSVARNREGSISVIGAISPPGGDFSEPVTVHSKRYTKTFWALDKDLASARHFPSINWIQSYSGYLEAAKSHWTNVPGGDTWYELRQKMADLLAQDDTLQKVVMLIGSDALPESQKLILFTGSLIKEGFLQQVAFDATDSFCPPEKQILLAKMILHFHARAESAVAKNIITARIESIPLVADILRAKMSIANNALHQFEELNHSIDEAFDALEAGNART
jgi:V/A-type H+/Na+-transporting ATPase subunit A